MRKKEEKECKQANNIYSTEINKRNMAALRLGARKGLNAQRNTNACIYGSRAFTEQQSVPDALPDLQPSTQD